jgi:hypothetical protein
MTTLKVMTIAATLSLAPGLALAMCTGAEHVKVQSCADGSTWDSATQTCVPVASS